MCGGLRDGPVGWARRLVGMRQWRCQRLCCATAQWTALGCPAGSVLLTRISGAVAVAQSVRSREAAVFRTDCPPLATPARGLTVTTD